jgi:hypothetical protein
VLGYAVPMPVVVRTRAFDQAFYQAVAGSVACADNHLLARANHAADELFGRKKPE